MNIFSFVNLRRVLVLPIAVLASEARPAAMSPEDILKPFAASIANGTLSAVSVGVIRADGTVVAHAGAVTKELPHAPNDHTLYEIGSITKVFTSLLLADAVIRGEVKLDTAIAELMPADALLPDDIGRRITLRMLATHTSGLPVIPAEIPADDYRNPYATYRDADLWTTLRNVKLVFEPGTKAGYSNLAAGLLGTLLARNAGVTYDALLASRITGPLGLHDTVVELSPEQRARFTQGFDAAGRPVAHWDFAALVGAGGIRSTTVDLLRFAKAMLHPENTPLREAIELAWTRQELAATFVPGGQALGWFLGGDGQVRWHNGMTGGFHAALFVDRPRGIAVVALMNRGTPIGTPMAEQVLQRASGRPEIIVPNRDRAEVPLATAQLDRCTGTFRLNDRASLVIERRHEALFVTPTGQPTDRLFAATDSVFFSRRAPIDLEFQFPPEGGAATAVVIKQGGRERRALRVP